MKVNRFKNISFQLLALIIFLTAFASLQAEEDLSAYVVTDLKVEDIPDDDGSGLMISWKPLPKEKRIIEYRIYRGVTPDSLFVIGKLDINVKIGPAGEVMYYYDKDFNYFLDTNARGKLKKEKQQAKDSPIYRGYPRDLSVTGEEIKNYVLLGIANEKDFFYDNKKITKITEKDTTVYAGLKLRAFPQIAKKLIEDKEYYYTVIAVSESRKYYPHADPQVGIPRENSPEKVEAFNINYLEDSKEFTAEWELPIFHDDVRYHTIYYFPKSEITNFDNYVRYLEEQENYKIGVKSDSTLLAPVPVDGSFLKTIFRRNDGYPYVTENTARWAIDNGRIFDKKFGIDTEIDPAMINEYYYAISLIDNAGYETFSDPVEVVATSTLRLPVMSSLNEKDIFMVKDVKNDKGDSNLIIWGKPIVRINNTAYLNDNKTRLLINYELYTNEYYKVRNVYFSIFDKQGNLIKKVNEFFQDNIIKINIPENTEELYVEMTLKTNREMGDYKLTQNLKYSPVSRSIRPDKVKLGEENIEDYYYLVYKRNKSNSEWRMAKKVAGYIREYEDNVSYTNYFFPQIHDYDLENNLFLVNPALQITEDLENDTSIRTNLYLDEELAELPKNIERYQKEIDKYTAMKDTVKTEAEIKNCNDAIDYYTKALTAFTHPYLEEVNSIKNHKARIKDIQRKRTDSVRSFEYKMVKTDLKGNFVEAPVYYNGDVHYFMPVSNWFNTQMIPALIATFVFGFLVFVMVGKAKKGHDLYIRPIAGIQEIDNAIGRATEMGRPILFVPGLSGISDVATLAGLSILGRVAKKAAEYDTKILVPVRDYIVLPIAQEIVREAHYEAGRPDTYDKGSVFFITTDQFPFVAGVNGIMVRERTATNFYMGMFWAEALIMTENGSATGAIQIAGTDAITQIPFFITTCDYTLLGEELYAASAYLAKEPLMLGTLKAQDYTKLIILIFIIVGTILSTAHLTFLINSFPKE